MRLVHSPRTPRDEVLFEALRKAARHACYAEREIAYARCEQCERERDRQLMRCERIILRAQTEKIINDVTMRRLIGVILEAAIVGRWHVIGVHEMGWWQQIDEMERALSKAWGVQVPFVPLRLAG